MPILRAMVQDQARIFHSELCNTTECEFMVSDGWVTRWQKRFGVHYYCFQGEADSVKPSEIVKGQFLWIT